MCESNLVNRSKDSPSCDVPSTPAYVTSTTCTPKMQEQALLPHIPTDKNRNKRSLEKSTRFYLIAWMVLGVLCRVFLGTKYSWLIGDNALLVYTMTYISSVILQLYSLENDANEKPDSKMSILEMALPLFGISPRLLATFLSIKRRCSHVLECFSLFFIPFVAIHLVILVTHIEVSNLDILKTINLFKHLGW